MHPGPFPPTRSDWSAPPPPARGGLRLLAFGCLGVGLLGGLGAVTAAYFVGEKLVGTSLASADLAPGAPAALSFTDPGKGANAAWLEVDVTHTHGFQVMGDFTVSAGGRALGRYHLDGDLSGRCANPVVGQNGAACVHWRFTQVGAAGTVSGRTRLFEIPAQAAGAIVTVAGTLYVSGGVTPRRLALLVRD